MSGFHIIAGLAGAAAGALAVWLVMRSMRAAASAALLAQVAARDERIVELQRAAEACRLELERARADVMRLSVECEQLKVRLDNERSSAQEKIALLNDAKVRMQADFENLANRIFEEKSRKFTDQNKSSMDVILNPLREQIGDFKKKVEDVYDRESQSRAALLKEITILKDLNQQIGEDATNLTNALKGDSKAQGNWGEYILEKILEFSGLKEGNEYSVQQSETDGGGRRRFLDVVIHLPEGKDIIIDSKVALTAYERYYSATGEAEKLVALKDHIASIRSHIKTLNEKSYQDIPGIRSVDFVLMFIPVEAAFMLALDNDRDLYAEALGRNITIVTPSTLLATLKIIANMWRTENQNRNAIEIAERAGALHDKFVGFVADLQEVGKHIDQTRLAYDESMKKLTEGKGNLVRQSSQLVEMGIKARKRLPVELVESGGE